MESAVLIIGLAVGVVAGSLAYLYVNLPRFSSTSTAVGLRRKVHQLSQAHT
jgi:hypothetical protein